MKQVDPQPWLQRAEKVQGWLERIRLKAQPHVDRWLESWRAEKERPEPDFVADADLYMIQQEPLRARVLLKSGIVVLSIFIIWAAVAQIDEITRGEGKVIPSRQLQVLQSLDGGIVAEIAVQEGQVVEAGQTLLKIDPTRFVSSVRENRAQYLSLLAKAARLRALAEGKPFEPPPEALKDDPKTVEEERRLYEARTAELDGQVSISRQQLAQKQQELNEAASRRTQAAQDQIMLFLQKKNR